MDRMLICNDALKSQVEPYLKNKALCITDLLTIRQLGNVNQVLHQLKKAGMTSESKREDIMACLETFKKSEGIQVTARKTIR